MNDGISFPRLAPPAPRPPLCPPPGNAAFRKVPPSQPDTVPPSPRQKGSQSGTNNKQPPGRFNGPPEVTQQTEPTSGVPAPTTADGMRLSCGAGKQGAQRPSPGLDRSPQGTEQSQTPQKKPFQRSPTKVIALPRPQESPEAKREQTRCAPTSDREQMLRSRPRSAASTEGQNTTGGPGHSGSFWRTSDFMSM